MFIKLSYTQLQYRRKGTTGVCFPPLRYGMQPSPVGESGRWHKKIRSLTGKAIIVFV